MTEGAVHFLRTTAATIDWILVIGFEEIYGEKILAILITAEMSQRVDVRLIHIGKLRAPYIYY